MSVYSLPLLISEVHLGIIVYITFRRSESYYFFKINRAIRVNYKLGLFLYKITENQRGMRYFLDYYKSY